jgi:hypothetical protein
MAVGIQNYPNIDPPDFDFPNGRTTDNPGNFLGTPVNLITLGDYQQWFAKIMRIAGLNADGIPDSEYNGFQYLDAALIAFQRYRKNYVPGGGGTTAIPPYEQALVFYLNGIGPGSVTALPNMASTCDGHTVKVVNESAGETVDITADINIDSNASPYTQPIQSIREYTLIKSLPMWAITEKFN